MAQPKLVPVRYVGPFAEVEFELHPGIWRTCAQGEVVQVPASTAGRAADGDDLGEGLLAQADNWALARAPKLTKED